MKLRILAGIVALELILGQIMAIPSEDFLHMHFAVARIGNTDFALDCPIVQPNFQSVLWLLPKDHMLIGASVQYDHNKYRYLASTGQLLIKDVTMEEAGIYRCIVNMGNGLGAPNRIEQETSAVRLEVKPNFINIWDEEFGENLIRGSIAGGIFMGLLLSICLLYKLRYKKPPSYKRYSSSIDSGVHGTLGSRRGTVETLGSGRDNLGVVIEDSDKLSEAAGSAGSPKPPAPRRLSMVRGEILVQHGRRESQDSRRGSKDSRRASRDMRRLSHLAALEYRRPSQLLQSYQLNALSGPAETPVTVERSSASPSGAKTVQGPHAGPTGAMDKLGVNTTTTKIAKNETQPGATVIYVSKD